MADSTTETTDPMAPVEAIPAPGEAHELQPWTLLLGLITVAVAALFLIDDSGAARVDGQVAGAVLLVVAGAALVIRSLLRAVRRSG